MSSVLDYFLDLLYPTKCILCRREMPPGKPSICPACQAVMPLAAGMKKRDRYFTECVSALRYEGDVKHAIRRYKFEEAQIYHIAFGELVAERIYEDLYGRFDILSWVPLSRDRRRDRGYDQVELIARDVSKRLNVPLVPLLRKKKGVKAQSLTFSVEERRQNIADAYRMKRNANVMGQRVLIIDDVVTSGSTLSECAKTLMNAGAKEVLCATLATASH